MNLLVKINDLNISFKKEVVFSHFFLRLKKGEKLTITGGSGKGKSTLINLLTGFIPSYTGVVSIAGITLSAENIHEIRKMIAYLPQEANLNFKTVKELFLAPFSFEINKIKIPVKEKIIDIFNVFELSEDILLKKVKDISGGQRQRIMLASCLLLKKPLLLLDEPTSALDDKIKKKISNYILKDKDLTIIAASHDAYWIKNSDKIINLK